MATLPSTGLSFLESLVSEYFVQLRKFSKWNIPSHNFEVGDLVCLYEDGIMTTKWPLARVVAVYPGRDGRVRVVSVKTTKGTYKRPTIKVAFILQAES